MIQTWFRARVVGIQKGEYLWTPDSRPLNDRTFTRRSFQLAIFWGQFTIENCEEKHRRAMRNSWSFLSRWMLFGKEMRRYWDRFCLCSCFSFRWLSLIRE
jgi:hypothetical protein